MLVRYRWYRIQLPSGNFDLADVASKQPLDKDAIFGFVKIEGGMNAPRFRFLWRTTVIVTRLDEDANPSYEEVASVSFTEFAVVTIKEMTFLRIENPGRNIRDLLNAFESLVGLGFTAKPLTFEKTKPTSVFGQVEVIKLIGLKVVGAVINEDLVARMEFVSKQGMIVENMRLLDGLQYKVDLAVFELIYQGVRGQVAFSSNGMVKVSGQLASKLVHLIEMDLAKIAGIEET